MHQLPIPPSEVRPTASFDSGNTQALVTRLQRFLESLEPRLHHPEPADLLPGEHPEHAYLAGHLMLLGFQLLLVRRESPESLRLLQDAAFTLTRFHLKAQDFTFAQAAYDISSFYGYLPTHAAHLTWNDLPHAIRMMHSTAQHAGLPLDPTWLPGGLAHRLIPHSSTALNPLCPPPLDLCPPRTACPAHQSREADLLSHLPTAFQVPGDREEALATLLLLHLNARDQLTHLPVLPLLELTASLLLIARDERRDAQQSTTRVSALLAHFHTVRQEFGPLRIQALRPGTVIARRDRANTILTTYSVLRDLCSQYETALPRKALIEHQLWRLFDAMDVVLAQGFSPDSDPPLFLLVQVTNLWALTHITRAPGMPLPLVVEIGCQLAGHDPLWGWSTLQGLPDPSDLNVTLQYLVQCLQFLGQEQLDPEHQLEVLDLIQQWGCEVFALARQLGLRFPQHDRLEDLLIGPPRAQRQRLLLGEEYGALQARFIAVADAINAREAELQAQESLEDLTVASPAALELQAPQHTPPPLPAAEPSAPEAAPALLLPAHVLQARSLLAGRHVTLLGGIPDPAHHAALVENLALAGLDWIPSARYDHGHHVPISADTGLVILAVRWMGHAHNGLRDLARQRGIPYILHPGGLNPSNVAYQVLKQVSHRLHASTSTPVEFTSLNGEQHGPSRRCV